ncbi:hypothetical protein QBC46DRAFT_438264 [Diplogelasinospora grovesii]|uniref:Uncharacterized protein n=1 Tax=Diplogelasinospora grovesii TaxID=303347 RepID=A0AAN6N517_9PEZI|nr:hypothetical protein QBC46DRAFT_438264 [Diplogelasinospora grovesii]
MEGERAAEAAALGRSAVERTPVPTYMRSPLAWREWDGEPTSFYLYLNQLIFKYNHDGPLGLIDDKVAWYEILQTLPEDKKQQIEHFWVDGAREGTCDPRKLFQHLDSIFGTKAPRCPILKLWSRDGQDFPLGDRWSDALYKYVQSPAYQSLAAYFGAF